MRFSTLLNTQQSFGWPAIIFHWLSAIMTFVLFATGWYMVELNYYDPWYKTLPFFHKGLGILLCLILILRLAWSFINVTPTPLRQVPWENYIARIVHICLYGLLFSIFISGYLISTASGASISVFGWFELPALITAPKQEDIAGTLHEYLAYSVIAISTLHALAALKHHFIYHNNTLKRILRPHSRGKHHDL